MKLLRRWDRLMRTVEAPYALSVEGEKNRFIVEVSTAFPSARRITDAQADHHVAAMIGLATKYQGIAIRLALKEALSSLAEKRTKEDWEKLWLYLVRLWVERHGAARARESANTTRRDIQRVIDRALADDIEFDPVRVASEILVARDLSAARADVIARTEVHNAMMFASQEGAATLERENGVVLKKRWVPVLDERTRVNHASMASVAPIALDGDFMVGGERMARPGDPRGSSGNVIGCRCVLAFATEA